jgi:hypothetical protein
MRPNHLIIFRRWLERSKDMSLKIYVQNRMMESDLEADFLDDEDELRSLTVGVLDIISPHAERICSLELNIFKKCLSPTAWIDMFGRPLRLKHLRIAMDNGKTLANEEIDDDREDFENWDWYYRTPTAHPFTSAPLLQKVDIFLPLHRYFILISSIFPWNQLRHLAIEVTEIEEYAHVIANCPALTTLRLSVDLFGEPGTFREWDPNSAGQPLRAFEHLTELHLSMAKDHPAMKAVLSMTLAPSLEALRYRGGAYGLDLRHDSVKEFFAISGQQLRELDCRAELFQTMAPSFSDLLLQVPNLVKLTLVSDGTTSVFDMPLGTLTTGSGGKETLIPKLEILTLHWTIWYKQPKGVLESKSLEDVVRSRTAPLTPSHSSERSTLKHLELRGFDTGPELAQSLERRMAEVPSFKVTLDGNKVRASLHLRNAQRTYS